MHTCGAEYVHHSSVYTTCGPNFVYWKITFRKFKMLMQPKPQKKKNYIKSILFLCHDLRERNTINNILL